MQTPILIRSVLPSDISFIYSSWLKSYKFGSPSNKQIRSSVYFEEYREIIDSLLLDSEISIACMPDEPVVILGYLISKGPIVHYCFVKEAFRQFGIAKTLLQSQKLNKFTYTHHTLVLSKLNKQLSDCIYNPFILYRRDDGTQK